MRISFLRVVTSALFVMVPVLTSFAQCFSDEEIIGKVNVINGNLTATGSKKILLLKALQASFLGCGKAKNAAYAQIVHRLGDVYGKIDDQERAIFYTKEAISVNSSGRAATDPSFLANSYFNLGIFYKRLHLLKESHYYFDRCIVAGSRFQSKYFIAFMAFEQKAYSYYQSGDYEKGIELTDEGLLFADKIGNKASGAALLAQRAQAAGELGLLHEAEANIKEAITLLEKDNVDVAHLATGYSVYADLLCKKGNANASIYYYNKAYELNKDNGNFEQCARDLLDLGSVYADELKDRKKAVYYYNKGVKLAKQADDLYQVAALYSNIGVVYGHDKKYNIALKFYQRALNTLPLNFTDTSLKANLSLNMLKLVSNDCFVTTIIANKGNALLERYKQSHDRKDLKLALATFEVADQAFDVMRWKQSGEQSKLLWRQKTKEMYEQCITVCYELKDIEKAYYFFEKSRAVLLNDQLSETKAEEYISKHDRLKEKQLRIKTYALSKQLLAVKPNASQYAQIKADWRNTQDKWEDFIKDLERKYPVYYQYKYDRSVYPYRLVRGKLRSAGQHLVEYFKGDSVIYILVLSASQQKLLKISYPDYAEDTRSFLSLISNPDTLNQNYDRYCVLAHRLYNRLFEPLRLKPGRTIISTDNHFIPFEALLPDMALKTGFLAKHYTFSYTHSLRVLMKKRNRGTNENVFMGIAPLSYGRKSGLSPLQGSGEALERIAAYFKDSKLFTGIAASRSAFLKNAAKYRLLQIYAHADADSAAKEPRLYLADSAIYLSEIQKLNFPNTDLVTLSACNTGIGKNAIGEGVFSMARAFMMAGVPAAITNLWQVDDKVTYRLTEAFYKNLQQGMPKDEALNRAKLDFINDNNNLHTLPYFWAATIIVGNTDGINDGPSISSYLWVLLVALIVGLGVFFRVKRKR